MNTIHSIQPLLAVLVSLAAVVPIVASGSRPNLREFWTFAAGVVKLFLIASMLPLVLQGSVIEYTLLEVVPGIAIRFRVDGMGMLFALVASVLWIVTSIYSVGYMRGLKEHSQTRFFAFFAVSLSATIGVAFSANLFTLWSYIPINMGLILLISFFFFMQAGEIRFMFLAGILCMIFYPPLLVFIVPSFVLLTGKRGIVFVLISLLLLYLALFVMAQNSPYGSGLGRMIGYIMKRVYFDGFFG